MGVLDPIDWGNSNFDNPTNAPEWQFKISDRSWRALVEIARWLRAGCRA